jgi:hypothetical protein
MPEFPEMANAKRTLGGNDDLQPRGIAETLVNLNQFHGENIAVAIYASIHIFIYANV